MNPPPLGGGFGAPAAPAAGGGFSFGGAAPAPAGGLFGSTAGECSRCILHVHQIEIFIDIVSNNFN